MASAGGGRSGRLWRVGLGLAVSGAALVGLVFSEGPAARAEALAMVRSVRADQPVRVAAAATKVEAKPAADPRELEATAPWRPILPPEAMTRAPANRAAADGSAQAAPAMPDFVGMRIGAARRQASKLGIELTVHDEYGHRISAKVAHQFRVRKQSVAAGTALAPGATLTLRARKLPMYALGY